MGEWNGLRGGEGVGVKVDGLEPLEVQVRRVRCTGGGGALQTSRRAIAALSLHRFWCRVVSCRRGGEQSTNSLAKQGWRGTNEDDAVGLHFRRAAGLRWKACVVLLLLLVVVLVVVVVLLRHLARALLPVVLLPFFEKKKTQNKQIKYQQTNKQ